jgi:ABC-type lipoprotein export system ATPase subunit
VIELDGVTVSYRQGGAVVTPLRRVTAVLGPGPVAVTGPSGSGKSTLLRVVAGLQAADAGTVVVDGTAVAPPGRRVAGDPRIALVHQDYRLVEFLSVADNLRLCAELHARDLTDDAVADALETVGLGGHEDREPATLSGGEQQRVAIARGLVSGASVLLADEPTGALDVENTRRVADLLVRLGSRPDVTVVVATHDPEVAARMAGRHRLADGELRPDRSPVPAR